MYVMHTATVVQLYDWMSLFLKRVYYISFELQTSRVENVGKCWKCRMWEYREHSMRFWSLDLERCFGLLKPALGRLIGHL